MFKVADIRINEKIKARYGIMAILVKLFLQKKWMRMIQQFLFQKWTELSKKWDDNLQDKLKIATSF